LPPKNYRLLLLGIAQRLYEAAGYEISGYLMQKHLPGVESRSWKLEVRRGACTTSTFAAVTIGTTITTIETKIGPVAKS
jgi:hypothetical protein